MESGYHDIIHHDIITKMADSQNRPTKSTGPWDRRSQKKIDPAENVPNKKIFLNNIYTKKVQI